jgi:thiamine-phosphate pyrophosphorylase
VKIQSARPLIYLITDGSITNENFASRSVETLGLIEQAVAFGVPFVQIREKNLFTRLLFELVSCAVRISSGSQTKILLNDRADVALAAGADGIHLTESSLPADVVRNSFLEVEYVGVSTHSLDGVRSAAGGGADFAVFGPVFTTPGKGVAAGTIKLREACETAAPFPILALGGIDADNIEDVLEAGAAGIAAIRFLNNPASFRLLEGRGFLQPQSSTI